MKRFLPHFSIQVATFGWRWRPWFEHRPAKYYRANVYPLANNGDRISQPSTHFRWGPITMSLIWP
jgi:hypothetical protein